jgi:uncharacterized protein YegL
MNRFAVLENRDYTLILDRSGSMMTADMPGGRSRWLAAQESTLALAAKCEQLDPDGITVYLFSGKFRRFENVTAQKVQTIFQENDPMGSTNLAAVLQHCLDSYFQRKAAGQTKANGELVLVVTDGEPDDQRAVMKTIIDATRKMDRDEELGFSFIQIGRDAGATRFLKALDDELVRAGAKFDIVDTVTLEDMEDLTMNEILLNALND